MKKLTTLLAFPLTTTLFLVGCNTFRGVGQDVQKVGEKIEDSAKKK